MTTKTDPKPAAPSLPGALADVALIDAPTCAAAGAMSVSWWHSEVAAGRAPPPAIQRPRCTRWRVADVRRFWTDFAAEGQRDNLAAASVKVRASKASAAAKAKRSTRQAQRYRRLVPPV